MIQSNPDMLMQRPEIDAGLRKNMCLPDVPVPDDHENINCAKTPLVLNAAHLCGRSKGGLVFHFEIAATGREILFILEDVQKVREMLKTHQGSENPVIVWNKPQLSFASTVAQILGPHPRRGMADDVIADFQRGVVDPEKFETYFREPERERVVPSELINAIE